MILQIVEVDVMTLQLWFALLSIMMMIDLYLIKISNGIIIKMNGIGNTSAIDIIICLVSMIIYTITGSTLEHLKVINNLKDKNFA